MKKNLQVRISRRRVAPCFALSAVLLAASATLATGTASRAQALEDGASPAHESEPDAIATFAQTVSRTELQEWRQATGRKQSTDDELDLAELILTKALAAEAERLGLDQRAEVRLAIEMQQAGVVSTALKRRLAQTTAPTAEAIDAKYQQIKDTFTLPRRWRIRNLFLWHPRDASDEVKAQVGAELDRLRRRVLAGEDFAELATQHSDSQTRFQGGLIGNVYPGVLPARLDEILFALEPGEVSRIVEGPNGPSLFFCDTILPKVHRTEQELREIAGSRLTQRSLKTAWNQRLNDQLAAAQLRFDWSALDSPPAPSSAAGVEGQPLPLVEFAGGSLTGAQVQALLGTQAPLSERSRAQIRTRVEQLILSRIQRAEAEQRSLLTAADRTALRWIKLRALETQALLTFVEARFAPLTETEIRQHFEANRDQFTRPRHFDLGGILLTPSEEATPDGATNLGHQLMRDISSGRLTFEQAARTQSQHPSRTVGGHLGSISRTALSRIYGRKAANVISELEVGQLSGVIQEGDMVWIFQLLESEPARPKTYAEAKVQAENQLGSARSNALADEVRLEWFQRLDVTFGAVGAERD